MGGQKRRTEIQIETHEVTIIRFGKTHNIRSLERELEGADVVAHSEIDETSATEEKEKQNEK